MNDSLVSKKVHKVIKFNKKSWLKPYINMNTELRKKAKKGFEKYFFKLMNNALFGKTTENLKNYRDSNLYQIVIQQILFLKIY